MSDQITPKTIAIIKAIRKFSMLAKFTTDEDVKVEIADLIDRMASTAEQIDWLAEAVINNFNWWPGPMELRALFCMRFKPADGIEKNFSTNHPIAADAERRAVEHSDRYKLLGAGEGAQMVRQLLAGKVENPDAERAAQDERWYALCKAHGVAKAYRRLSNEFACAEVPRRAEILAQIEREVSALPKGGA